jgi:hypothetical protein
MHAMSIDIASVGRTPATPLSATPAAAPPPVAAASPMAEPVTVDAIPASPPPEVHEAMNVAANAYDDLKASGREMRFRVNEATGKLTVEVHDIHGNLMFAVPGSKALDVAAGGTLD